MPQTVQQQIVEMFKAHAPHPDGNLDRGFLERVFTALAQSACNVGNLKPEEIALCLDAFSGSLANKVDCDEFVNWLFKRSPHEPKQCGNDTCTNIPASNQAASTIQCSMRSFDAQRQVCLADTNAGPKHQESDRVVTGRQAFGMSRRRSNRTQENEDVAVLRIQCIRRSIVARREVEGRRRRRLDTTDEDFDVDAEAPFQRTTTCRNRHNRTQAEDFLDVDGQPKFERSVTERNKPQQETLTRTTRVDTNSLRSPRTVKPLGDNNLRIPIAGFQEECATPVARGPARGPGSQGACCMAPRPEARRAAREAANQDAAAARIQSARRALGGRGGLVRVHTSGDLPNNADASPED